MTCNARHGELQLESATKTKMIAASEKAARDEMRKHLQNKLNIKQMEFREGYHQMEERMVRFLCGVVKGLVLNHKMHFVSLFKMLKDVTKWNSGFDWNLLCSASIAEHRTDVLISQGYKHVSLKPLLIASLDRDQPITFKTLKAFDALRAQEKLAGDEEGHDSRPSPLTISNEMLPDILDRVFDGSDTNPLNQEIVQWSNEYSEKYPENNSPTMMQEQLQSAGRSVGHRPGTPKLQPEVNGVVDHSTPTQLSRRTLLQATSLQHFLHKSVAAV